MNIIYNGEKDRNFKEILGEHIQAMAAEDEKIVYLDADLANCINMGKFIQNNPDRGFDCGIAEANMIGIASGLSSAGFKPIVHTFGPFASRRCFDQVFLSAGYAGNSITVIGTDAGVCAAFNGGTHMPFEDAALYRVIPNAYVFEPADTVQLKNVLSQCVELPGVKYIRTGRKQNYKMYEEGSQFKPGKGVVVREYGTDAAIFASGIMLAKAVDAADLLKEEGINVTVADMFTWKPLDNELVLDLAKSCGVAVVAENHNKVNGLFSAVTDLLCSEYPIPAASVGVEDRFGQVGPQDFLEEEYGLTAENIIARTRAVIARK